MVLALGLLGLPGAAGATPVYETHLAQPSLNQIFKAGTGPSLSGGTVIAGLGFIQGTVDISGGQFDLTGYAGTGQGTTAGFAAFGRYTYDDVIFTEAGNPGATGTVSVRANFRLDWRHDNRPTNAHVRFGAGLNGVATPEQFIHTAGGHDVTLLEVDVPLNTLVTFTTFAELVVDDPQRFPLGQAVTADATFRFVDFDMQPGFTANSASLDLVDNVVGGTSGATAPAPPTPVLAGLALGLMPWLARRRIAGRTQPGVT